MISPSELCGRRIAAVFLFLDSDENACCIGTVERCGDGYSIQGNAEGNDFRIPLSAELLERVRQFEKPNQDMFDGAESWVPLTVGQMPEGERTEDYQTIGLRWPPSESNDS